MAFLPLSHNCHLFSLAFPHPNILYMLCEDATRIKIVEGNVPSITIKTTLPFAIPSENNNFVRRFLYALKCMPACTVATTST